MKAIKVVIYLLLISGTIFISCSKVENPGLIKVGLVTVVGALKDRGLNQQVYGGMLDAATKCSFEWKVKESLSATDIVNNIRYFTDNNYDVITTLGFDAAQPTLDAANLYPNIKFLLADYSLASKPTNMAFIAYAVDQASFPCGLLAAYWACLKHPAGSVAGYVAVRAIPNNQQLTKSFIADVGYFNTKYRKQVSVVRANAQTFTDTLQDAHLADSLIRLGAEVIFACAGKTGNGALYQAKIAGKSAIGVDTDQFLTIPDVGNILLTSCMKNLNEGISQEIVSICMGVLHGGKTLLSTLENKGVDLAPYHNFEPLIPDTIKSAILTIKQGIIAGTIYTGWK